MRSRKKKRLTLKLDKTQRAVVRHGLRIIRSAVKLVRKSTGLSWPKLELALKLRPNNGMTSWRFLKKHKADTKKLGKKAIAAFRAHRAMPRNRLGQLVSAK
jgi:hypothetical protein